MTTTLHNIPPVSWALLGVAIAGVLFMLLYSLRPLRRATRHEDQPMPDADAVKPKATVVIYCQSDEETLMNTLQAVCEQDYPDFDVVVVCDSGAEYASNISEIVEQRWSNVYVTYLQPGSHNLSRLKLANTIGIKAAKGEVVLTTRANISIPSTGWLSGMMAPFCGPQGKYIDIALGLTHADFNELHGPGRCYRRFDSLLNDTLWAGYASMGHPYRGDGFNLALRRKAFFDNKGYANCMYLLYGEDDVYINQICTPLNTRLVASPHTILTVHWGESARRMWSLHKAFHNFTRRWLPNAPFLRAGSVSLMQWLVTAAAVAAALLGLPSVWPIVAASVTVALLWTADMLSYRKVAKLFGVNAAWWAAPLLWLRRPIANAIFKLAHLGTYKKNFTWQR